MANCFPSQLVKTAAERGWHGITTKKRGEGDVRTFALSGYSGEDLSHATILWDMLDGPMSMDARPGSYWFPFKPGCKRYSQ